MSNAGHEHAAADEDVLAKDHAAAYDPQQARFDEQCRTSHRALDSAGHCWTSVSNPTDKHSAMAEAHRKAAAEHRLASQSLRDAESTACSGIAQTDRDMSPFEHVEDIVSVSPLRERVGAGKGSSIERNAGAVVTFRAVPGMTAEWMQRLVDCHLARAAAAGHDMPEMAHCPLVPKGASARVTSTGSGFAVAVRADTEEGAREVLRRAEQLKP